MLTIKNSEYYLSAFDDHQPICQIKNIRTQRVYPCQRSRTIILYTADWVDNHRTSTTVFIDIVVENKKICPGLLSETYLL